MQRSYSQSLKSRINEPRKFIQVLMGPRQVGKTTIVNQLLGAYSKPGYYHSADAVSNATDSWLEQRWQEARLQWKQTGAIDCLLVFDEIQKIPNWSEMVKRLWDEDSRLGNAIKVILLGSSRLLIQQGLTESLAGRFETTYVGHWSYLEMKEAFGWTAEKYVWYGGYPGSASLVEDELRWKRYINDSLIETSISKDILMLTRVDKPALMRRLFELGCAYSGQILSFTKMLGQLHDAGNTVTLSHYLRLLDTAGLLAGLEKQAGSKVRSSSPKLQVHNTALMSAQHPGLYADVQARPELWGRWVESSVGAHLINASHAEGFALTYWRDGNDEIDFVLERQGVLVGLEVKSGATQKASGMNAFRKKKNPDKTYLIGQQGIPWQEFLAMHPVSLF